MVVGLIRYSQWVLLTLGACHLDDDSLRSEKNVVDAALLQEAKHRLASCETELEAYELEIRKFLGGAWPSEHQIDASADITWADMLAHDEGMDHRFSTDVAIALVQPKEGIKRTISINKELNWSLPLHYVELAKHGCDDEEQLWLRRTLRYWQPFGVGHPRETCLASLPYDNIADISALPVLFPALGRYLGIELEENNSLLKFPHPVTLQKRFDSVNGPLIRFYLIDEEAQNQESIFFFQIAEGRSGSGEERTTRIGIPLAAKIGFYYAHDLSVHLLSFLIPDDIWKGIRERTVALQWIWTVTTQDPSRLEEILEDAVPRLAGTTHQSRRQLFAASVGRLVQIFVNNTPRDIDTGTANALMAGIEKIAREESLDFSFAKETFDAVVGFLNQAYGVFSPNHGAISTRTIESLVPEEHRYTSQGILHRVLASAMLGYDGSYTSDILSLSEQETRDTIELLLDEIVPLPDEDKPKLREPFSGTDLLLHPEQFLRALLQHKKNIESWQLPTVAK